MIIDKLENAALYRDIHRGFKEAFTFLQNITNKNFSIGKHIIDSDNIFAISNEYKTKNKNDSKIEAHKQYIDIQYIVEGTELIGYSPLRKQTIYTEYNNETDLMFFQEPPSSYLEITKGMFAVFFPEDLHMPGIFRNSPVTAKKVVVKIKVNQTS